MTEGELSSRFYVHIENNGLASIVDRTGQYAPAGSTRSSTPCMNRMDPLFAETVCVLLNEHIAKKQHIQAQLNNE